MASDWMIKEVQNTISAPKPTAPPPIPVQQPAPAPQAQTTPQPVPQEKGKFFSGSWWDKTMDVLNTPLYAIAGFAKGGKMEREKQLKEKGLSTKLDFSQPKLASIPEIGSRVVAGVKNIIPGIANRQQFGTEQGDLNVAEDLGIQNKTAQAGYNLGLSLVAPSLPLGKIPGVKQAGAAVAKAGGKIADIARESPVISKAAEIIDPYFKNPELGKMVKAAEEKISQRTTQLANTLKKATAELTPAEQTRVGQLLEGGVSVSAKDQKYAQIAGPISELADSVGKEAVDLGLLPAESYQKFKGKYMTHIWKDMLEESGIRAGDKSGLFPKISGQYFKARKGAEGYVRQFGPAVFKGLGTEIKDIETAKLYKEIAQKYGDDASKLIKNESLPAQLVRSLAKNGSDVKSAIPLDRGERIIKEGFSYAPLSITSTKTGQLLKDIQLPNEVIEAINKTVNTGRSDVQKGFDAVMGTWKAGKTFWNPAYHVRNLVSNQILSDMSTGKGLPATIADWVGAIKDYNSKTPSAFVKAAEDSGLIRAGYFGDTLNDLAKQAGLVKETNPNKIASLLGGYNDFTKKLQTSSEEVSKLSVFRSWVEKLADETGKTVEQALSDPDIIKKAVSETQQAIFSPGQISKHERRLASSIVPFYSFTRQAVPFTAKTALNNPERITKYDKFKKGVEGLSPEGAEENKNLPDYRKQQIRLPIKNKEGNYAYLDPQYVYPFGNFDESSNGLPFGLSLNPLFTEVAQQQANKDFYFDQPITKSNITEKASWQRADHAARTLLPTLYTTIKNKLYPAATGQVDYAGRKRSLPQAGLDAFGIKTSFFDPAEQAKFDTYDKKTKLKSIQSEMLKYQKDPRLSTEEKKKLINKLTEIRKQTLAE